jgi:hypothetical protein
MRSQLLCAVALLGGAGVAHAQTWPGYAPNGYAPGPGGGGYPPPGGPAVPARYYQGYAQPFPFFPTAASPDQAARPPAVSPPPAAQVAPPTGAVVAGPVTAGPVMAGPVVAGPPLAGPPGAGGGPVLPEQPFNGPGLPPWQLPAVPQPPEPKRLDDGHQHMWVTADYVMAWFRGQRLATPLVTTGGAADLHPGALGQPNTGILFGDSLDFRMFSGVRWDIGIFLDEDAHWSLDGGGLILFSNHTGFSAASDDTGNPIIARPIFNVNTLTEESFVDALPGAIAGGVVVDAKSELWGFDVNGRYHCCPREGLTADALIGFRYLRLRESLGVEDRLRPLAPNRLVFEGTPLDVTDVLDDRDSFRTTNNFYGGQVGGSVRWEGEWFSVCGWGKVALGATDQTADIAGSTTLITPGGTRTAVGGILALPPNIGQHHRTAFGVIAEAGLTFGVDVNDHLRVTAGYSFLYWNQVLRPGGQISRAVNPSQVPTDVTFGMAAGPVQPAYRFNGEYFWLHAINVGMEYRF